MTRKVHFGAICGFEIRMAFACKYPENETLLVGDAVPPKARILEVWVWIGDVHKNFG